MRTIKRELEDSIDKDLRGGNVVAIAGPSKCGKSALLRNLFKKSRGKSAFYDFETEDVKNGVITEKRPCENYKHLLNLYRLGDFVYRKDHWCPVVVISFSDN